MRTTLVVLAHPEAQSFNAAWAQASREAAERAGDRVLISDLVGQGFDAVERADHYADPPAVFDPLKVQESYPPPPEVASELDNVRAADRIILHFPIWWFAPPAVLKGWTERVLMHGKTNSVVHRFDRGLFRGRSVLFCVTTGSRATESGPDGREGNVEMLLWPLAMTFRYLGFDVLRPEVVHGVHGYHEGGRKAELEARLEQTLTAQKRLLAGFDTHARMPFNADVDFDAAGRLKEGATSVTPFISR